MKKEKRKKTKVPEKRKVMQDCLSLWSQCVRTRDRKCRICGSEYRLQAHHVRSRQHHSTMLDLDNGIALCASCHIQQKFRPEQFSDRIIDLVGEEEYARLKRKSIVTFQYDYPGYLLEKDRLTKELKRLKDEMGMYAFMEDYT